MVNCVLLSAWSTPHKYCVLAYKLFMGPPFMVLPANLSYNLAIIFPVFRELVNVLNIQKICFWKKKNKKKKYIYIYYSYKRNPYLTSMAYYLDFGNCNPHYLVPNCSAINLEYITRNLVKIKQLCLSIGSARYRGGMVPKVALSYHWITLVKTLVLDYTLILLPQYINNRWDHHRQQYILHICGACCGSDAE